MKQVPVDFASLALQVAPVSYYCLTFFIGLRPKLGNTYYHIIYYEKKKMDDYLSPQIIKNKKDLDIRHLISMC